MCGRYSLATPKDAFQTTYGVQAPLDFSPRYNIHPEKFAPVIRANADAVLESVMLRWGFPAVQGRLMNCARGETVADKPSFRAAFRTRRVVVPASSYFEWQVLEDQTRQPYLLHLGQRPLGLAGLWTQDAGVACFTFVTIAASAHTQWLHPRQPVILEPASWQTWLAPEANSRDLAALIHAEPRLEYYPVSKRVGKTANDDATLLGRVDLN